jgi:hypothetical protein
MIKLVCVLFTLVFLNDLHAQFKVTTKIVDFKGFGVELATVQLVQKENSVTTRYTDSLGVCTFLNVGDGEFTINASLYGQGTSKTFSIHQDTTIVLELVKSKQLEAATINLKKPVFKRKADRMVFNVENSLVSYGNNLYNMLAMTPGVRVDDKSVSILGKGEAIIYIDDQVVQLAGEDLINYLYNLPSDDVSRIEVISNPPAKYQAEGSAGIINIVLKAVLKKGYSGDVNSSVTRNTYWSESLGAGINYNKDKIVFKDRISVSQNAAQKTIDVNSQFPNSSNLMLTNGKIEIKGINNSMDFTYKLNEKSKFVVSNQVNSSEQFSNNSTSIAYLKNAVNDSTTNSIGGGGSNSNSMNSGLNFTHVFDSLGKKLSIDYNYFIFGRNQGRDMNSRTNYLMSPNLVSTINSSSKQYIYSNSVDVDVELPYETFYFNLGGRVSSIVNQNEFQNLNYYNGSATLTEKDKFQYTENIQALYFTGSKSLKQLEFQFGLRVENSIIKSYSFSYNKDINYSYLKFFPTLYITYTLKEEVYLGFNYSRRLERPDYSVLNPFRFYMNANQYVMGNPFLRPSFTGNYELYYAYKDKFSSTLSLNHTTEAYTQIPIVDLATNKQVYSYFNFLTTDLYNFNLTYSYNNTWLQSVVQTNIGFSNAYSSSSITYSELKGFSGNMSLDNQIKTSKKGLSLILNGAYSFPSTLGIIKVGAFYGVTSGLMYRTKNRKFVFGLTVNDVFRSMKPLMKMYSNGVFLDVVNYNDNQSIRFSLTYNFGNKKVQVEDTEIKNNEEIDRTKTE